MFRWSVVGFSTIIVLACGGSDFNGPPPTTDVASIFWRLNLNFHAITLATRPSYDTVTLIASPQRADGTPLISDGLVTFEVAERDTSIIVTSVGNGQGVVKVHRTTAKANVKVIARQTIGSVTLTDTVIINIVELPPTSSMVPELTTFSMQPSAGDSAKVDCSGLFLDTLTVTPLDRERLPISGARVYYWSSDNTIARIDAVRGIVTGVRPGRVMLYAQAYVYGISKTDSVSYTVGESLWQNIQIFDRTPAGHSTLVSYFSPAIVTIGVGGIVNWMNRSSYAVDVVFDDPAQIDEAIGFRGIGFVSGAVIPCLTATGRGNIPALDVPGEFAPGFPNMTCTSVAARAFPIAGRYPFHSTTQDINGVVIVTE